jgi:hypothetical protein
MQDPNHAWQKLAAAARRSPPAGPPGLKPPPGFASRMVALRHAITALARTLLWRKWSVLTAMACAATLVAVFVATRCTEPRPLINPPPPAEPTA